MREMTVKKNDAGQRLDRFLRKAVPGLPGPLAQKYIRTKRIKVGGKRTEQRYRLLEGDVIQLYIDDGFFGAAADMAPYSPAPAPGLQIAFEDAALLIVTKPPGLLCHSGGDDSRPTLVDQVQSYLYTTGQWDPREEQSFVPALCNRLDRNTGGLVLAAKTAAAMQAVNEKLRSREIRRRYLCAVHGRPERPEGRIAGYLLKDGRDNTVRALSRPRPGAQAAVTRYRTLETRDGLSLMECELETGRTHQIRVQLAAMGCPLLGDRKYGGGDARLHRGEPHQALWAYRVGFPSSTDAGPLSHVDGREVFSTEIPFLSKYFDYRISY